MSVAPSFLVGVGACVHFLLSVLGPCLAWIYAGPACAVTVPMSSHVHQSSGIWKMLFSLSHPSSDSCNLSTSSSAWIPDPWGEWFNEDIPFRIECSKVSYSLHILHFCVSASVPIDYKKLLWWWLSEKLIYVNSRMSSGIILCVCVSFLPWLQNHSTWFFLGPVTYSFRFLTTLAVTGMNSISWNEP